MTAYSHKITREKVAVSEHEGTDTLTLHDKSLRKYLQGRLGRPQNIFGKLRQSKRGSVAVRIIVLQFPLPNRTITELLHGLLERLVLKDKTRHNAKSSNKYKNHERTILAKRLNRFSGSWPNVR